MKIGCLLVATRKYKSFLNPLLESLDKYFLLNHEVEYNVFYDDPNYELIGKRPIKKHITPSHAYPYATLYRYKEIIARKEVLASYDHLLYIDSSMLAVAPIDETIINPDGLIAVEHPGFYPNRLGTYETNPRSLAYFDCQNRRFPYVQGSVQGGRSDCYLHAIEVMNMRINFDENNGIIAIWHDESHWNKYIHDTTDNIKLISPSYSCGMYPDGSPIVSCVPPIILKLNKNHAEIRS